MCLTSMGSAVAEPMLVVCGFLANQRSSGGSGGQRLFSLQQTTDQGHSEAQNGKDRANQCGSHISPPTPPGNNCAAQEGAERVGDVEAEWFSEDASDAAPGGAASRRRVCSAGVSMEPTPPTTNAMMKAAQAQCAAMA